MKIVGIIAEYNPFHNGHQYQIDRLRDVLGEDTAVIAVMSGNYTQRGEIAIADKSVRARAAVDCGVNLVLELPFPFSMASAEFFAAAGVHMILFTTGRGTPLGAPVPTIKVATKEVDGKKVRVARKTGAVID